MISSSEAYKKAITGDSRKTYPSATIDIISPDIALSGVNADSAPFCDTSQVFNRNFRISTDVMTLEYHRWLLDGSVTVKDLGVEVRDVETGLVLDELSDENGNFSTAQVVEVEFVGIKKTLQLCTIAFSDRAIDSVPKDFKVEILQGGTVYFEKDFTGNLETEIVLEGFDIMNVDVVRITVHSTVLPYRRVRIVEVYPGIYERWTSDDIVGIELTCNGDFSDMSVPYGTCNVEFDNTDRKFEFRSKDSIFKSIEERQNISFFIETETNIGVDRKPVGVYYQFDGGWKTSENAATISWSLVDIIGLLADRRYIPTDTLPTTLEGWAQSLVSQLGNNFVENYIVDPDYANIEMTATAEEIADKTCGELLNDICMYTDTWARADLETGRLAIEPLWKQGNEITLDNMNNYPVIQANEDVATVTFKVNNATEDEYTVSGNASASSNSLTVENPFIRDKESALKVARTILQHYGGLMYELTYRGDMTSEIGDIQTLQLDESSAASARLKEHSLSFSDGVLQECKAVLIQPSGQALFEASVFLTGSGTWKAPAGVKEVYIIVAGGGGGGTAGTPTRFVDGREIDGEDGEDGKGGDIFFGTFQINEQQNFNYNIGEGGKNQPHGSLNTDNGGITTFGVYTSYDGEKFEPSFTDLGNGNVYGRSGIKNPKPNSADGGAKGIGGKAAVLDSEGYVIAPSTPPTPGDDGASGCVVVWWDKPEGK